MVCATVGEPTRWFIMLVPSEKYAATFREIYDLGCAFRSRYECFEFVAMYVKVLRSDYLSGDQRQMYCEMNLVCGMSKRGMLPQELSDFVDKIDDICLGHGAFRYMHTRTGKDPARRHRLDPNAVRRASRATAAAT